MTGECDSVDADVAIVGHGPVGNVLAILLAQQGHQVVVLERWSQPYGLPRAVHPDNATLERHATYTFQARWAERWHQGRVLLAGDAAHQMPPFAGRVSAPASGMPPTWLGG